jgi:hypothetical protein
VLIITTPAPLGDVGVGETNGGMSESVEFCCILKSQFVILKHWIHKGKTKITAIPSERVAAC